MINRLNLLILIFLVTSNLTFADQSNDQLLKELCLSEYKPNEINKCAYYWGFEKNNNGEILRVKNTGWNFCQKAVEVNIASLTKYYDKKPEIGIPDSRMILLIESLEVPNTIATNDQVPLLVTKNSNSEPLIQRISASHERLKVLKANTDKLTQEQEVINTWNKSSQAIQILLKKTEGIENHISLSLEWPTIAEFSPKLWDLKVCQTSPEIMNSIDDRMKPEYQKSVWPFTFFSDLMDLLKPFNSSNTLIVEYRFNSQGFKHLGLPFFIQNQEIVNTSFEKSLYALSDVRKFKNVLTEKETKITAYANKLNNDLELNKANLKLSFVSEQSVIHDINTLLQVHLDRINLVKVSVKEAEQLKFKTLELVNNTNKDINSAKLDLNRLVSLRDKAKNDLDIANNETQAKRIDVLKSQSGLDSTELDCLGVTYENCSDNRAKLEYDKSRYNANVILIDARTKYTNALELRDRLSMEFYTSLDAVFNKQLEISSARENLWKYIKDNQIAISEFETKLIEANNLDKELAPIVAAISELRNLEKNIATSLN